jgi:hypothetical protein
LRTTGNEIRNFHPDHIPVLTFDFDNIAPLASPVDSVPLPENTSFKRIKLHHIPPESSKDLISFERDRNSSRNVKVPIEKSNTYDQVSLQTNNKTSSIEKQSFKKSKTHEELSAFKFSQGWDYEDYEHEVQITFTCRPDYAILITKVDQIYGKSSALSYLKEIKDIPVLCALKQDELGQIGDLRRVLDGDNAIENISIFSLNSIVNFENQQSLHEYMEHGTCAAIGVINTSEIVIIFSRRNKKSWVLTEVIKFLKTKHMLDSLPAYNDWHHCSCILVIKTGFLHSFASLCKLIALSTQRLQLQVEKDDSDVPIPDETPIVLQSSKRLIASDFLKEAVVSNAPMLPDKDFSRGSLSGSSVNIQVTSKTDTASVSSAFSVDNPLKSREYWAQRILASKKLAQINAVVDPRIPLKRPIGANTELIRASDANVHPVSEINAPPVKTTMTTHSGSNGKRHS